MTSVDAYRVAYQLHYNQKEYNKALIGYLRVIRDFPDTAEAKYSRQQIPNIMQTVNVPLSDIDETLRPIYLKIVETLQQEKDKQKVIAEEYQRVEVERQKKEQEAAARRAEYRRKRDHFLVTTGLEFADYEITNYYGVVSGCTVQGTGLFSETSAGISDFLGVQNDSFSLKIDEAKDASLEKVIEKAIQRGANALIGTNINLTTFSNNMIGVMVFGTAVKIEKAI